MPGSVLMGVLLVVTVVIVLLWGSWSSAMFWLSLRFLRGGFSFPDSERSDDSFENYVLWSPLQMKKGTHDGAISQSLSQSVSQLVALRHQRVCVWMCWRLTTILFSLKLFVCDLKHVTTFHIYNIIYKVTKTTKEERNMSFNHLLPACPDIERLRYYIEYPSAALVFLLTSLSSLVFAILVGFKYNSVKIFNRFDSLTMHKQLIYSHVSF
jgi:hypothetical protein